MNDKRMEELIEYLKDKRKERLIERLQEEKAIAKKNWNVLGTIHGKREAYELNYSRFKKIEEVQRIIRANQWSLTSESKKILGTFERIMETEGEKQLNSLTEEHKDLSLEDYIIGWLKIVTEIWNEIKDELDRKIV